MGGKAVRGAPEIWRPAGQRLAIFSFRQIRFLGGARCVYQGTPRMARIKMRIFRTLA